MKNYLFLIISIITYANCCVAQSFSDLLIYKKHNKYCLLKEKDTIAIVEEFPKSSAFFRGNVRIISKDKFYSFYKDNKGSDLHLNHKNRTFIFDDTTYKYVIDFRQKIVIVLQQNKMMLKIEGINLNNGISVNYYDKLPDIKLIFLSFMISHNAFAEFEMKHGAWRLAAFVAGVFGIYSVFFLMK